VKLRNPLQPKPKAARPVRGYLWRLAIPALAAIAYVLIRIDYWMAGGDSLKSRLVANGLLAGVAGNLIALLIGVVLVDQVIRTDERRKQVAADTQWNAVRARISRSLLNFSAQIVAKVRGGLRLPLPMGGSATDDVGIALADATEQAANAIEASVGHRVHTLTAAQWRELATACREAILGTDRLITRGWLSPAQNDKLIDIEQSCHSVLNIYEMVPEAWGIDGAIPPEVDDAAVAAHRSSWYTIVANELARVVGCAAALAKSAALTGSANQRGEASRPYHPPGPDAPRLDVSTDAGWEGHK
jgi:hypothetical protein